MSASPLELPIEPVPRTITVREELARIVAAEPQADAQADAQAAAELPPVDEGRESEPTPWWADVEPVDAETIEPPDAIEAVVADEETAVADAPSVTTAPPLSARSAESGVTRTLPPPVATRAPRPRKPLPPPRFEDRRHPVRAAVGLVALVVFAGLVVAAAIAVAIAAVAFALRNAAGG